MRAPSPDPLPAAAPDLLRIDAAGLPWRRRRNGRGFVYLDDKGRRITDPAALGRIRALAIPPAYADVRIAADPRAHIQAIGCDDAGRLQYRYHPDWERVREERKGARLAALAKALPRIRRTVSRDLRRPGPCRRKALAAVVTLLDRTHIRIGGENYVHTGRSRGAATLLKRSLEREGTQLRFSFRGKRGQQVTCALCAPALARAIDELAALPGSRLFQYRDEAGRVRRLTAADVNHYLEAVAGCRVSAKDFRTLAATSAAAERLAGQEPATSKTGRRRQVKDVMREVADLLKNTPTVVCKSYVHDCVIEAFDDGSLTRLAQECSRSTRVSRKEALVMALLKEARAGRSAARKST